MSESAGLVDLGEIERMAADLAQATSRPEFVAMVQQARDVPCTDRQEAAESFATVDNVKSRGIPVPEGFRITTRTFENPEIAQARAVPSTHEDPVVSFDENRGRGAIAYDGVVVSIEDTQTSASQEPQQPPSTERIRTTIREEIEKIGRFVAAPAFQGLLGELYALPESDRERFVVDVVLNEQERARRGILVPEGMTVQRSAFADRRPTLFCVSRKTPLAYPWDKVTVTFDGG